MPLPAPRIWEDGEEAENIPSADNLNLEWRDSFDFLLGTTRPIAYLQSNISQAMAVNTFVTINWQVESLKRGGMTHAVNSSQLTVPYTGQYAGFIHLGFGTFSTLATRAQGYLVVNGGANILRFDMSPQTTGGLEIAGSFTANLTAGDILTVLTRNTVGTTSTTTSAINRPRFAAWYVGDFS